MPKRLENALPKPRKLRNSLVVYADKKRIVFGNYDDTATWKKFSDFCQKRQNGENETPGTSASSPPSDWYPSNAGEFKPSNGTVSNPALIADLVTQFLEAAQKTKSPGDFRNYKKAGQALWHYQSLPTAEFDAYLLLQVQERFVSADYARTHCNKLINFIVHMFKWGEVRRLVPPGKSLQLKMVEPLLKGIARESNARMPVEDDVVERTLPLLLPMYQAFVRIAQSTGARPSEICRMRVADVDRANPKVWVYRLIHHKTMRHDKRRVLAFGRKDQAVMLPYLDKDPNSAVFSPKDAVSEYKQLQRDTRKTPFTPSQRKRDKNRKRHPKIKNNEFFTTGTIGKRVQPGLLSS